VRQTKAALPQHCGDILDANACSQPVGSTENIVAMIRFERELAALPNDIPSLQSRTARLRLIRTGRVLHPSFIERAASKGNEATPNRIPK